MNITNAIRIAMIIAMLGIYAGCEERSELEKCADDRRCVAAMHAVDDAERTVDRVCPKDQNKTNEACDAATAALNSAEELQSELQPK